MVLKLSDIHNVAKPFIVIESESQSVSDLIPELNYTDATMRKNRDEVFRKVRGDKSRTKRDFANEVSAAFQFPEDFEGRSWDAFDELMNNLDWLPATHSYILLITNADQLLSKEPYRDFKTLMDILRDSAANWESGSNHDILVRAYQREVVPKSSKLAIILQHRPKPDLSGNFGAWLKSVDVPTTKR